jgi:hypothetical protein
MTRAMLALLALALTACTTVSNNDGQHVTLKHDPGASPEYMAAMASKVCGQNGKASASYVATTMANQSVPEWLSSQLSTYRCE